MDDSRNTSVLIADSALESLASYHGRSQEHAQRVDSLVDSLGRSHIHGRLLRLSGAQRPLWQCDVDDEHCAYVTMGQGAECVEARIAFFGNPLPENSESFRSLLFLTGETPYQALPDSVCLEEAAVDARCPPVPELTLADAGTLDLYLQPDEPTLLHVYNQPARPMDDLHGRPFRLFKQVRTPVDLPARLSSQQKEMLTKPRPLFLQGVAGSGKTTLLTHFAHQELVRSRNEAKILIVAYTDALKRFIERLLGSLRVLEPVDLARVEVHTWRELCGVLSARCGLKPMQWAEEGQFAKFASARLMASPSADLTVDLIPELHEILRAILKGASPDPQRAIVDRAAFLEMKELASDAFLDRRKVYEIAEQYQYFLRSRDLYDDLDAAQTLFGYRKDLPKYDYVLVDETQDYTLTQLRFLSALALEPSGLVFAGDMNQVVYPSQFNWEKVRAAVYQAWQKAPPELQSIYYNYRNPLPVSRIAEKLLEMRSERLDVTTIRSISNQAGTPMPLRVHVNRTQATAMIEQLAVEVGSLGVIQEIEEHLDIEGIEFQRTFTPQSVKGLEFNVVCLVGFNGLYRDLAIKGKRRLTPRQLLMKFGEVYVATTRTRGQLLLLDSDAEGAGLWDDAALCDLVTTIDAREVTRLIAARYKVTSRDGWRMAALDFEDQQAFAPAGEAWERAGDHERAAAAYERAGLDAKACALYKAIGSFALAARIAEELGDFVEAAELYSKVQAWEQAADCCVRAGNGAAAAKAYERVAEASGNAEHWGRAAELHADAKRLEDAARCFDRAGHWTRAARIWKERKELLKAAECYALGGMEREAVEARALHNEAVGDFAAAARLWERINARKQAAVCYERAGEIENAQRLFQASGDLLAAARLYRELEWYAEAAELYRTTGTMERAAECFELASKWTEAAHAWLAAGATHKAVACYEKAGEWGTVGDYRRSEGNRRKAADAYERAGNFAGAAAMRVQCSEFTRAAQLYERAEEWLAAAENWKRVRQHENAMRCFRAAGVEPPTETTAAPATQRVLVDVPPAPIRFKAEPRVEPPASAPSPPAPLPESVLDRLVRDLLQLRKRRPGSSWEYAIPETSETREFVAVLRTAQHVTIPEIVDRAEDILARISNAPQEESVDDTIRHFRAVVDEVAARTNEQDLEETMGEGSAAFACIFEFAEWFDLAGPLWESVGEKPSAVRCYRRAGRLDKARDLCWTADDPELAMMLLESAGFYAEAALRAIEVDMYMRAASDLDLCGQNRLATIAKAVGFDFNGKEEDARIVWDQLERAYTKEGLHAAVDAIVHPAKPASRGASPRRSLFAFAQAILQGLWRRAFRR